MKRVASWVAVGAVCSAVLSACGGGGGGGHDGGPGGAGAMSFLGTTGVFAAWADPGSQTYAVAPTGSYAGKRQVLHGTVDFTTGQDGTLPAGVEVFKGADGHIYALDLIASDAPATQQLSNETLATVDDTCSLSGTQVAGASYDYAGVFFAADLQNAVNSTYVYRLPGPDGVCNSADDVVHMVKTGMSASDAPITVSGIPVATVRTPLGGIAGFVVKSGAQLVMVDANFAAPVVLGTFAAPIGVAQTLPVGTVQGYPTGQLYVVDGKIVYVDYVKHSVSAALATIPGWTATNAAALYAASPTTLYFAINTAATKTTAASTAIYAMPANGSAAPALVDAEAGRVDTLAFPVGGTNLVWGVANPNYTVRTLAQTGGSAVTLASSAVNVGTFLATATTVYYTTWAGATDNVAKVVSRTSTSSGIVGINGTVIQAALADSSFAAGGEQFPWPDDTTTTQTPYETVLQVQGLSPVSIQDPTTGYTYVVDGVSGATVVAIDTATNRPVATLGTLPVSGAAFLTGTFRDAGDTGFLEATTSLSTNDPATRDLYLLNARSANSIVRVTGNL